MIDAIRRLILFISLATLTSLVTGPVLAQDSELEFSSTVAEITPMDDGSAVITIVVRGIEIPVTITPDTSIEYQDDDVSLDLLTVGDAIEVEANLVGPDVVAREVKLLGRQWEEFRFKGQVSAVDFDASAPGSDGSQSVTLITVMGVDVYLDDDARVIVRGEGQGVGRGRSTTADITELSEGDRVDVRGIFRDDALWVEHIKIGERDMGEIELEGVVQSLTTDGFTLAVEGAGELVILVDENTEQEGQITAGSEAEVEGIFAEDLSILAFKVESEDDGDDEDEDEDEDDDENDDEDDDD